MQPTQDRLFINQQAALYQSETSAPSKRVRESLAERTESAAKKHKIETGEASQIPADSVMKDISDANAQVAMQIESVKHGNPVFAPAFSTEVAGQLKLQEEILNFIESVIKTVSSKSANQSALESAERTLTFLHLMHELASANRLNDVLAGGEFEGTSIPWFLAHHGKWELLTKMVDSNIDIDFNSSPTSGKHQGISVFIAAIVKKQQNLVRHILSSKKTIDINAVISGGPFAGANALYLMAVKGQWDLVKETLAAYPRVDINARIHNIEAPGPVGANLIHIAAVNAQWDIVKSLLVSRQDCQVNNRIHTKACPGITLPMIAAREAQWDVFETILKMHPGLDINAAITDGNQAGYTVLFFLGLAKRWDLFSTVLDLYPYASVSATAHQGPLKGLTPLLMAAEMQQWPIVAKAIQLQPNANVDTSYERSLCRGATPFWHAVNHRQWPIALTMLSINPFLNVECGSEATSPLTSALMKNQHGFTKLLLLLGAKDPLEGIMIKSPTNGLLTPLPIEFIAQTSRNALEQTRVKIYETLYNSWNRPENDSFAWVRSNKELRSQIACEILIAEHPEIPFFPGLQRIVEKWVNLDDQRNKAAKERVAILAFRQYRWNNGIFESPTPKVVREVRQLIVELIAEVEKSYPFECTHETRRKIIKQIGGGQKGDPRLTKSFVEKAIKSAVMPENPVSPAR
ncbi:hypothetical protein [Estrella lausannensis]|uniref:Uncharacterized protein n=1 Tax=Estrella lausannensis TaxID=483423 RepID=A0A0H5DR95_9BACT|nr:hypothetical protein [Estrella lausannensis]CRX38184.1 hypothetical protein ELAC_0835 [Estrella lausannensis]